MNGPTHLYLILQRSMFLEKLTALVSPLFTGFCHPKTSYDAFLNPASSSSYYPISLFLFKTNSFQISLRSHPPFMISLEPTPIRHLSLPLHLCHLIISMSLNPVALSQSSLDSAVGDFLLETVSPVGFQAPLSFLPISPALFSNFSCQCIPSS